VTKLPRPSRLTVVRVALWLALMVLAAGAALLVSNAAGLLAGSGAGLALGGALSAAVLYFVVDAEPVKRR
jgi:hypothetical protein